MAKRHARLSARARLVVTAGLVTTLGMVLVLGATSGPGAGLLRGWPWYPGHGIGQPQDQAVLAYQPKGPDVLIAQAPETLEPSLAVAGDDAKGAIAAITGLELPALTVVAPLTGDLAPKSASAVLMDALSGTVLYAKNEHEKRPIASVTKIMTLTLIFDALDAGKVKLTDSIVASSYASGMGGSQIWLEPGEAMSLDHLLIAIAVGSANDACVAVAEHLYGTHERFVEAMNEKARTLGMANTNFVNSHGLDDPDHHSTAYDVALMSRYAATRPELLKYTSLWMEYLRDGKTLQANHNRLVRHYPGCDGLKTGWTSQTGHCIAATAARDGTRLISVVLGAPNSDVRFAEATAMLNAGFANFASIPLASRGEVLAEAIVERGTAEKVSLVIPQDFGVLLRKGEAPTLTQHIEHEPRLFAPITAGQAIAQLVVEADGEEVGRCTLVAASDVERAGLFHLMWKAFSLIIRGG